MKNDKTKKLEKRLVEVFGEKASLAITNARLGAKGYYTRVESYGLPIRVDAYKDTQEAAEELALVEFEKEMELAIKEKLFQTQPLDRYETYNLSVEELGKIYKYSDIIDDKEMLEIKSQTTAQICKLDDGRYECVITSPYMQIHARGTGTTKELAVFSATMVSHDIINPSPIKVGDWPINR